MVRTITKRACWKISDTGETILFRDYLERPPAPAGFSRTQHVGFAHWSGGAVVGVITEMRRGLWIKAIYLRKRRKIAGRSIRWEARVYRGEKTLQNIDEIFHFVLLPPQIAVIKDKKEQIQSLAKWVQDIILNEARETQQFSEAKQQARLKERPARLPHEAKDVDHYKNQQQVALNLLRREWPLLAKASEQAARAATESAKREWGERKAVAYIADYRAMYGELPDVRDDEAISLWKDENYVRLMNSALDAPKGRVDKRDWQLVNGWIEKNYYQMNEAQLEAAFANDYGYAKGPKGHTLATRARRLGLVSALKRGRPERHVFRDES